MRYTEIRLEEKSVNFFVKKNVHYICLSGMIVAYDLVETCQLAILLGKKLVIFLFKCVIEKCFVLYFLSRLMSMLELKI